jgi:hypothetical protein
MSERTLPKKLTFETRPLEEYELPKTKPLRRRGQGKAVTLSDFNKDVRVAINSIYKLYRKRNT